MKPGPWIARVIRHSETIPAILHDMKRTTAFKRDVGIARRNLMLQSEHMLDEGDFKQTGIVFPEVLEHYLSWLEEFPQAPRVEREEQLTRLFREKSRQAPLFEKPSPIDLSTLASRDSVEIEDLKDAFDGYYALLHCWDLDFLSQWTNAAPGKIVDKTFESALRHGIPKKDAIRVTDYLLLLDGYSQLVHAAILKEQSEKRRG